MVNVFMKKRLFIITIITFLIDRISKILVMNKLTLYKESVIIKNFLNIRYVKNDGAAWSILSGNRIVLIIVSLIVLVLMIMSIKKAKEIKRLDAISYGILFGGIFGNLFDRIVYGYVIDFIDVYIFNYDFPVFNIADSFIVIGVIILLIMSFRGDKNENKSRKE